jgi:hypothetical protein
MGRRFARVWGIVVAVMMPVLLVPEGAGAIIGGTEDGTGHPNVGFVIARYANGDIREVCTGTLIAHSVVLTAAHCLHDGYGYAVTFKSTVTQGADNQLREVTGFQRNEEYDVGVVFLKNPVNIDPAGLPDEGDLDRYRKGDPFTHVGYGVDHALRRNEIPTEYIRRTLTAPLTTLTDTLIYTRTRDGHLCSGDSGGPVFSRAGGLVALGNYVDGNCKGSNSGPRLDIEPVLSFLAPYVG